MRRIFPYLVFFVLTIIFFGTSLFPDSHFILYGGDIQDQFFYWKSYFVENIRLGTIPFWNPYSFSGTPFLAHPSIAPFYPLTLIFFLFPIPTAFSIYLFVHLYLAGIFMFQFVQKKEGALAGFLSGITFAFSGFIASRIYAGHVDIISTVIWMPLVFSRATEAIVSKKRRDWIIAVFALVMQILAGYQFVVFLTLILIFSFCVFQIIGDFIQKKKIHSTIKILVLFFFLSFGIAAVQYLPTLEFVQNSIRHAGLPYTLSAWGSYTFSLFRLFIQPFALGNPFPELYSYTGPGPNFFELSFYSGFISIFLLVVFLLRGLHRLWRKKTFDRKFLFYTMLLLFFCLMALGANFFLHPLLFSLFLPLRLFRFPSQYLIGVIFLLPIISGITLRHIKNKFLQMMLILFLCIDLFSLGGKFMKEAPVPTQGFDPKLIAELKKNNDISRVLPDYTVVSDVRKNWDFESGSHYKIQTTSGYNPIILDRYYHFIDLANKSTDSSLSYFNVEIPPLTLSSNVIRYLGIDYILVDKNQRHGDVPSSFSQVLEGDKYSLYKQNTPSSRYFFVDHPRLFSDSQSLESVIRLGLWDSQKEVLILKSKDTVHVENLNDCGGSSGKVTIEKYEINQVTLTVDAPCNSLISSSDAYYPGWNVKIDGNKSAIFPGNIAFRTFLVPKGKHTILLYYDAYIYKVGAMISLVSLVIVFLISRRFTRYVN